MQYMHCILKTIIGKITVFDFGESFALCQRFWQDKHTAFYTILS